VDFDRSERLAYRIRFLEHMHRPLAIALGLFVGWLVLGNFDQSEAVLANYGVMLALALGAATWLIGSMVLVGVIAILETSHHRLVSSMVLPPAILCRRRR
jgi:hypothetical protein